MTNESFLSNTDRTYIVDTFARNLKERMKEMGERQETIARKVGVKRQTISLYQRGVSVPDIVTLHRISNALEVSADWLIGLDSDKNTASLEGGPHMNIYPELKKIAGANEKIKHLVERLADKLPDCDGLHFEAAYLVTGCREKGGHLYRDGCRLDNSGLVVDDYYCEQYTGFSEDYFYGTLYFRTNVPGQFVAVPFDM